MQKEYWFVIIAGIFSSFVVFGAGILAELGLSFYQITRFIYNTLIIIFHVIEDGDIMTSIVERMTFHFPDLSMLTMEIYVILI